MNVNLQVSITVKWLLIGLGMLLLGSLVISTVYMDTPTPINIIGVLLMVFGTILAVSMMIRCIVKDLDRE